MISLDTSVLVRYLVGTPAAQARRAAALIDDDTRQLGISVVVLAECAHVLRTQYEVATPDIVDSLIGFIQRDNISLIDARPETVLTMLVRARSTPGRPIPDAMIAAASMAANALPLATFDRAQARYGIEILEPR